MTRRLTGPRVLVPLFALFLAAVLLLTLGPLRPGGSAGAEEGEEDVQVSFEHGLLSFSPGPGFANVRAIRGETGPLVIDGKVEGTDFSADPGDIQFPPLFLANLLRMEFTPTSGATGSFSAATGNFNFSVTTDLRVHNDLIDVDCFYSGLELNLATGTERLPYRGMPFTGGLTGRGALTATWAGLPADPVGSECDLATGTLGNAGAFWLGRGIASPPMAQVVGSSGRAILRLRPGRKPKTVNYKIRNNGNWVARNVKACVRKPLAKGIRLNNKRCRNLGQLQPGQRKVIKFRPKAQKKAAGRDRRLKLEVTANEGRVSRIERQLRVKKK